MLSTAAITTSELRRIQGLRVIENTCIPRDIARVDNLRAFFRQLVHMQKESYKVVHTYTSTPRCLGRVTARLAGVPVVLHHAAGWSVNDFSSLLERALCTPLEYLTALASTKTICVSRADAQRARHLHICSSRQAGHHFQWY